MKGPALLGIASILCLAGCGGGTAPPVTIQPNPVPTITTISPDNAMAGGAAFTLTINGTNFVAASIVSFGGTVATTTFISSGQLTAAIPAAAIASAGTAIVTVTNPAPGGGTSNPVNFTITSGTTNPTPTIASLIQSCAPVDGGAFNLLVNGSGLVSSSIVQWNGSDLPTTFIGPFNGLLLISAQVPASDLAVTGSPVLAAITVFNPSPGGGTSNSSNFTISAGGVGPQSIAVDPTGKFAYVANNGCPDDFVGNVTTYTINSATGALTAVLPNVGADFGPISVAVAPSGKWVYVANDGAREVTSGSIFVYDLDGTTGALTLTGDGTVCIPSAICITPVSIAVHPSGKFAYVADEGGFFPTIISMFTIDATTGAFTSIGTAPAGGRADAVSVDPTGNFVYVANLIDPGGVPGNVAAFSINSTTGALTSIGSIPAGTDPASVAVDPTGKFVYVANSGSSNVSMYTINTTTGALTSIGQVSADMNPSSVAVDPTGKFAYVTNSGSADVSMYTIDATTGALTLMGSVMAGSAPSSIAIHPSGKFAYVTNFGSNSVSTYSINTTTGTLTLIGTAGT